ncbi:MAG: GAF domain-containing protein [Anaerolineales bacterium]
MNVQSEPLKLLLIAPHQRDQEEVDTLLQGNGDLALRYPSQSDALLQGGRTDGILVALSALDIVVTLFKENGGVSPYPLPIIVFGQEKRPALPHGFHYVRTDGHHQERFTAIIQAIVEAQRLRLIWEGAHQERLSSTECRALLQSETLQQLGSTLSATLRMDDVLDRLLEALTHFISHDAAYVLLAEGDNLNVTSVHTPGGYTYPEKLKRISYSLEGIRDLRMAARTRKPMIVDDTESYAGWITTPGLEWVRAHLTVPLYHEDELVGLLNVAGAQPHQFNESDARTLASLAPIAALALRNARHFESEREARKLAETLQRIGTYLTQSEHEEEIVETVADQIAHFFTFRALLILFIHEPDRIVARHTQGVSQGLQDRLRKGITLDNRSLWTPFAQTEGPLNLDAHRRLPCLSFQELEGGSYLTIPLRSQERVIGFITLVHDEINAYTPEDRKALQSFGDLLIIAVQNAHHNADARKHADDLEQLRKTSVQINCLNDPREILETALTGAQKLARATGSHFFSYAEGPCPPSSDGETEIDRGSCWLFENVWKSQRPLIVRDYTEWCDASLQEEAHALVALPVTWNDERLGTLAVYHKTPERSFSSTEVSLLQLLAQQLGTSLHRARHFQRLQRDHQRLRILATLDRQVVHQAHDLQGALRLILDQTRELLDAPQSFVALIPRAADYGVIVETLNLLEPQRIERALAANWETLLADYTARGPSGYLALGQTEALLLEAHGLAGPQVPRSTLLYPLWIQGEVQGLLALLHPEPHSWSEEELYLGRTVAQQSVDALEKFLIAQELQQRLQDSQRLNRILRMINTTLDRREILRYVCCELQDLLDAPRIWAGLLRQGRVQIISQEVGQNVPLLPPQIKVEEQQASLWASLLQKGTLFSTTDLRTSHPELPPFPSPSFTRALLLAPLTVREQVVGLLAAELPTPHSFSERELELTKSIAAAVSSMLDNARLYQEAQAARHRAEAAYGELRHLDTLKSQFIQNVSHELRTPLTIIKGYVDLVLDSSFGFTCDPRLSPTLTAIQSHTDHLVDLVESVTTLEILEAGRIEAQPQPLLPILMRTVESIRPMVQRNHQRLVVDFPAELPEVNLDAERLELALWQLLDNAVKFNQEQGHIWIKAWEESEYICCEVRDEGIGIRQDKLDHIFERFYQVDGSVKRRYGGMGLGLSIAKEVVLAHGGTITAVSRGIGQGATFTLSLPIYQRW